MTYIIALLSLFAVGIIVTLYLDRKAHKLRDRYHKGSHPLEFM